VRKTYFISTSSTTNLTLSYLIMNPILHGKVPASNRLSYDKAGKIFSHENYNAEMLSVGVL
jgi:hypothetical protein